MKRLISTILICMYLVSGIATSFAATDNSSGTKINATILVNGTTINLERQPAISNNRMLVPARTVAAKLGARTEWYSGTGAIVITKDNTTIKMQLGSRIVTINNNSKTMETSPILSNGTVMVPVRYLVDGLGDSLQWDAKNLILSINTKTDVSRGGDRKQFIVVIDPGHGGSETGAVAPDGTKEKDLNLDIAKRLNALLINAGIKTYMTRTNDSNVGLYDRAYLANNVNADLFISIHNNSSISSKYTGSMGLYYPSSGTFNSSLTSYDLANIIENHLITSLNTIYLGVNPRPNLAVLRVTDMPAVIAEIAYMSNSGDLNKLKSASFRQKAAAALKDGVIEALSKL